jgi:hypothetical protein
MKSVQAKLTVCLFAAMFGNFLWAMIVASQSNTAEILSVLRDTYFSAQVGVLFIDNLPVAIACGVLFAWAVIIDVAMIRHSIKQDANFRHILKGQIIVALLSTVLYILLIGFVQGNFLSVMAKAKVDSNLAQRYAEMAKAAGDQGRHEEAYLLVRKAQAIVPGYGLAEEYRAELVTKLDAQKLAAIDSSGLAKLSIESLEYSEVFALSERYVNNGDLYSALYYCELALQLANAQQRLEALVLEQGIRERLGVLSVDEGALLQRQIALLKQRAIIEHYRQGQFIDAYYDLKELAKLDSHDTDLLLWLPKVELALQGVAFFQEEFEESFLRSSGHSLFAVKTLDNGGKQFIFAEKVIQGRFTQYLSGLELLNVTNDNRVIFHIKADYAKIIPVTGHSQAAGEISYRIITKSVLQERRVYYSQAQLLAGERATGMENIYEIPWSGYELFSLAHSGAQYATASLQDLLWFSNQLPQFGYDLRPLYSEILGRFTKAISLFLIWLGAMVVGWAKHLRYGRRPIFLIILILPVLPLVLGLIYKLLENITRVLGWGILSGWGFEGAFITLGVTFMVALIIEFALMLRLKLT